MAQRWLWPAVLLLTLPFGIYGQTREYALILEEPALVQQVQPAKGVRAAASDHLAQIQASQSRLASELRSRQLRVTGSAKRLVNAVFVQAAPEQVAALRGLPGVVAVTRVPKVKHHMDRATQLVRAPAAWEWAGGADRAGEGVKIAIIDSGVDLNHPGLQDDSLSMPQGFPKGLRQDLVYTNKKVIAARVYTRDFDDGTPRDLNGYGTATAMIAAGGRVSSPAGKFSGIAPKAHIGNYKVFDWNSNTYASDLIFALEDAYDDGMDIAVIPFGTLPEYPPFVRLPACSGSPLGFDVPDDACDVLATAVENAAVAGMIVIVSAGNDGDAGSFFPTYNTIHTPGTAPSAITVGASYNSFNTLRVEGEDVAEELRRIEGLFGDGPRPVDPFTAVLIDVASTGNDGLACSALPEGSLAGAFVLIGRGTCDFIDKVNHAARAGASAVVIYQDGDRSFPFNILGLSETPIPTVMVGATSGAMLKERIREHPGTRLTIDPRAPQADAVFDEVADFSSRGPSIDAGAIKPELVAPGYDLYTATQRFDDFGDLYDPSGYTYVGGTSYAAAIVAGAAALVKQQRPGFDPAKIKSALVNTATDARDETGRPSVIAAGAGKLNIGAAVQTQVTVTPSTLSFGILEAASLPVSLTLQLANSGADPVSLRFSVSGSRDQRAGVRLSQETLNLEPGQDAQIAVQLAGERPEPGAYEGYVLIEGGKARLRVPYLYLVSDGAPDTYFYLSGNGYTAAPNEENIKLEFRVTDRYGVSVPDLPVVFRVTRGNGRILYADESTDVVGKAAAIVALGSGTGQYEFTAEVADFETIPFTLRVTR